MIPILENLLKCKSFDLYILVDYIFKLLFFILKNHFRDILFLDPVDADRRSSKSQIMEQQQVK